MMLILVAACAIGPFGQERVPASAERSTDAKQDPSADIFDALLSRDGNQRKRAMWAVRAQHLRTVRKLREIVVSKTPHADQQHAADAAIRLLGELRAKEAVPILIDNLAFTYRLPVGASALPPFPSMPSVAALIEIGLPCLDPLIRRVAETDDIIVRERAAIVLDQVIGTDMAVLYVRDRCDREKDDARRQRITSLAQQIDKVERNRKHKVHVGPLKPPPAISSSPTK